MALPKCKNLVQRMMGRQVAFITISTFLLIATMACAIDVEIGPKRPDVVELRLGDSVEIARHKLELTLDAVLRDSLCPPDVVCIEAGSAVIAVTMRRGSLDGEVTLVLQPGEPEASPAVRVEGLLIRLVSLTKEPIATLEVEVAE